MEGMGDVRSLYTICYFIEVFFCYRTPLPFVFDILAYHLQRSRTPLPLVCHTFFNSMFYILGAGYARPNGVGKADAYCITFALTAHKFELLLQAISVQIHSHLFVTPFVLPSFVCYHYSVGNALIT